MKRILKSGLAAAALLALCAPAFALNPQPEPPGVHHNPNQSVQSSNPTLTAPVSTTCGAASGAPNVVVGGTQSSLSMSARPAPAASGVPAGTGVPANVDKCAKGASGMSAATPATPAATH